VRLPVAPGIYDTSNEQTARSMLERADDENHKKNRDLEVSPGRLILKSPDGTRWSITVDNSGVVAATAL